MFDIISTRKYVHQYRIDFCFCIDYSMFESFQDFFQQDVFLFCCAWYLFYFSILHKRLQNFHLLLLRVSINHLISPFDSKNTPFMLEYSVFFVKAVTLKKDIITWLFFLLIFVGRLILISHSPSRVTKKY